MFTYNWTSVINFTVDKTLIHHLPEKTAVQTIVQVGGSAPMKPQKCCQKNNDILFFLDFQGVVVIDCLEKG